MRRPLLGMGAMTAVGAVAALLALGIASCVRHTLRAADPAVGVSLPIDHAAHSDAQTEWWHFHGHVRDEDGRAYDWFLAFIRQHTDLDRILFLPVRWFADPFQVAFFTVTDRTEGKFHVRDKYAYPDLWAASASHDALALRHDSWRAATGPDAWVGIRASTLRTKMSMHIRALKPAALMGKAGYLDIPPSSSHYYYSMPRMEAEGTLVIKGKKRHVRGLAWFKHEWGFMYSDHVEGWVWFGAQLSNGADLVIAMIYDRGWNLADGSFAAVVERDGRVTPLALRDIEVRESGETWRSRRTDTVYPVGWYIEIPERDAALVLEAVVDAQEMIIKPANLWAGTLTVTGMFDGEAVGGDCFAEVAGLDRPFGRWLFRSGKPGKKKRKKKATPEEKAEKPKAPVTAP